MDEPGDIRPEDIVYKRDDHLLIIRFEDGFEARLPAEFLRVHSPSAELTGHGGGPRRIIGGKASVRIERIEPVGNYAIRPVFSDGHASGLFTWRQLYAFGRARDRLWRDYLEALAARGLLR